VEVSAHEWFSPTATRCSTASTGEERTSLAASWLDGDASEVSGSSAASSPPPLEDDEVGSGAPPRSLLVPHATAVAMPETTSKAPSRRERRRWNAEREKKGECIRRA